ncbi:MAG: Phosphoglycerate kinase [Candidatus Magasanikbacteria bacterium GW2011_GWA2_37_8]|uniref:Phosphoglycerate kinase n=1 Tax=Candidatus Magasanikbacteria bacterium GW2011_GWA2_37_8 TaxID=1619036 RepID=A0A0G0JV96_9BACT|nr:MAG: Phosphoglycerate kinase [Candidatus Magasanikbacteria bacterium GW2011_GWA2_37_8]
MNIRTIKQIKNLNNQRVLVRVDFNVPIKNGKVIDDNRIKLSVPTIEYLLKKKAKVILLTHLGRPIGYDGKGKSGYDNSFSLKPVVKRAGELLGRPIKFIADQKIGRPDDQQIYFANAKSEIEKMKAGEIVMLENMRFFPEEAKEISRLSKKIAELGEVVVLDCFAVAHREAASVSGVTKYLPTYAGFLLEKEIVNLGKATEDPKKPLVVVLGGVKMETKIPVLKQLLSKADYILIGGGLANTYFWAKGYKVGNSVIDKGYKKEALKLFKNKKVILPVDLVVGDENGLKIEVLKIDSKFKIQNSKLSIYDIGPETIGLFAECLKHAKTIIWNGAMGYFEKHPYEYGTYAVANLVADQSSGKTFGVCGGGETVEVLKKVNLLNDIDLVSTGGGAMLEFLSGKKLPGVRAVQIK